MKNILIVKPSALGDIVQATCILPVLSSRFPDAKISWLVFEHNAEVIANHPLLHRVITMKRQGSLLGHYPSVIRALREARFDAVIDIQGLLRSALLSFLTGCARRIGYANGREQSTLFYNEVYDIPTRGMHAVDGYLRLCEMLGAPRPDKVTFPLPVNDTHRERIGALIPTSSVEKPLVTLCPTARWKTKCWPEASFAALADLLCEQVNAGIILSGAPDEKEIVGRVARLMKHECLDLSGRLSIMELAAVLERSDLYVGNDSGVMHLASATGTKTVAIFGPTDPNRTGPYNPLATVVRADLNCMPCFKKECATMDCLKNLAPETVAEACIRQLTRLPE